MNREAVENLKAIESIKKDLATGRLTYDQAKAKAEPIIRQINIRAKEVAKRYNKKPTVFNFVGLMR